MKARWTLSLPQTSHANPVQCCTTHQYIYIYIYIYIYREYREYRECRKCRAMYKRRWKMSCHEYGEWHVEYTPVTWLLHMCDMTPLYVWHDAFMSVTRLICMRRWRRDCHNGFTVIVCNTTSAHSNTYVHNSHQKRLSWIIHCNTLQRSCNTMQHIYIQHTGAEEQIVMTHLLQHTATQLQRKCILQTDTDEEHVMTLSLQRTATQQQHMYIHNRQALKKSMIWLLQCVTWLQHTATHCNTLQLRAWYHSFNRRLIQSLDMLTSVKSFQV